MEETDDLKGQLCQLPDGQLVKIEIVHDDGYVTVRRTAGEWAGEIAVCNVNALISAYEAETAGIAAAKTRTSATRAES